MTSSGLELIPRPETKRKVLTAGVMIPGGLSASKIVTKDHYTRTFGKAGPPILQSRSLGGLSDGWMVENEDQTGAIQSGGALYLDCFHSRT